MDSECVNCDDLARERSAEARKWLGHFQQAAAENEELRARLDEVEAAEARLAACTCGARDA